VDVPLPETTQHRDTHDWSSVLSTPHWTVQFSEAAWSSTTGSIITSQGKHWGRGGLGVLKCRIPPLIWRLIGSYSLNVMIVDLVSPHNVATFIITNIFPIFLFIFFCCNWSMQFCVPVFIKTQPNAIGDNFPPIVTNAPLFLTIW